ncbi:MAG: hypothetical protein DRQ39_11590 [Gammaproteobacteria bacterium]|nr:MAG: hypothetical protein DRQ39_11590 [Gammaproteobacteria bacterium]
MLKLLESGKVLRVNAGFSMINYTELTLTFTNPNATQTLKTTADGVTLGGVDVDSLKAGEYVEYIIETGLLDAVGTWSVTLTYTNDTTSPVESFIGDCASFSVGSVTCN